MTYARPVASVATSRYSLAADDLVRAHLDLVRRIAWHVHGSAGGLMEVEDPMQIGLLALMEAGRTTRETNETAFAAYACTRIRGAMIDELRRVAPQSRGDMTRRQRIGRHRSALAGRLGREPTAHELADHLEMTVGDLLDQQARSASVRFEPMPEQEAGSAYADDRPDAFAQLMERRTRVR